MTLQQTGKNASRTGSNIAGLDTPVSESEKVEKSAYLLPDDCRCRRLVNDDSIFERTRKDARGSFGSVFPSDSCLYDRGDFYRCET